MYSTSSQSVSYLSGSRGAPLAAIRAGKDPEVLEHDTTRPGVKRMRETPDTHWEIDFSSLNEVNVLKTFTFFDESQAHRLSNDQLLL